MSIEDSNGQRSTLYSINNIAQSHAGAAGVIHFRSAVVPMNVSFPAFITQFSDNYNVGWGGDQPFGRTDAVKNYQSTTRQIQIAMDVVSESKNQAIQNFKNIENLTSMLYPVYSAPIGNNDKSRTISAPPLMRIKYANYIHSPTNSNGLLGTVQGINFQPKFESGHYITQEGNLIPMIFSLSFQFQPLHEHPLGFNESGMRLQDSWPWGASINEISEVAVQASDDPDED